MMKENCVCVDIVSNRESLVGFFIVKLKTTYEMRNSGWSSDVCSSDLGLSPLPCLPELRSYRSMTCHALRVIAAIVVFAISPLVITLAVSISSVFAYALFVWMHFRWTTARKSVV